MKGGHEGGWMARQLQLKNFVQIQFMAPEIQSENWWAPLSCLQKLETKALGVFEKKKKADFEHH